MHYNFWYGAVGVLILFGVFEGCLMLMERISPGFSERRRISRSRRAANARDRGNLIGQYIWGDPDEDWRAAEIRENKRRQNDLGPFERRAQELADRGVAIDLIRNLEVRERVREIYVREWIDPDRRLTSP